MINNDPAYLKRKFVCPCCGAVAQMIWEKKQGQLFSSHQIAEAKCAACDEVSIWRSRLNPTQQVLVDLASKGEMIEASGQMIYPMVTTAPHPNPDLPSDCKTDFEEARLILHISPRGAAALLRLVIQKLCKNFGEKGNNINEDIRSLVCKGKLPVQVQQALDVVRLVGNNAVHPGEISVDANIELVGKLFWLVNYIVKEMITDPNERIAIFGDMPQSARDSIERRDTPQSS